MDDAFPYADILILALIAGFVLLRLRGVLGQKIGHGFESPAAEPKRVEQEPLVIQMAEKPRSRGDEEPEAKLAAALPSESARQAAGSIRASDPQFTLQAFLAGAKMAFEMVFDAFVKGDRDTLKMLLSQKLFDFFAGELDKRKHEDRVEETTLLAVLSQEIKDISVEKSTARVVVKFVSEQVTVVRDKEGKIVEGDPSSSHHVEDEWTFERDITSRNPNWKIIDT